MRRDKGNIRKAEKAATHDRIVSVAARAIRRGGYDGTGIADIMQESGLTHGAFYAHFPSRKALLAEAASRACAESTQSLATALDKAPSDNGLAILLRSYLSKEHCEHPDSGCLLAALGSETWRQPAEVRRAATRLVKEMADLVARQSPDWGQPCAHRRALVTLATMVGALVLARAVDDRRLSDGLRAAALEHLIPES